MIEREKKKRINRSIIANDTSHFICDICPFVYFKIILAARVQDDNASIRSGHSSIYISSGQKFGGMISPDDRPGRSK